MTIRALVATVVFVAFSSPLVAHADVVWLLKEHAGVRITLEFTDIYGIRHKVSDGRTASLEEGGSDDLRAYAAVQPMGDDTNEASYALRYGRSGSGLAAVVNGAIVNDHAKTRLLHREEVGFRVDFKVAGPGVSIRLQKYAPGTQGNTSYTLYNQTKKQVVSAVSDQLGPATYGTFALSDGDVYVLIVHLESKGAASVDYEFYADFDSPGGVAVIPMP